MLRVDYLIRYYFQLISYEFNALYNQNVPHLLFKLLGNLQPNLMKFYLNSISITYVFFYYVFVC